MSITYVGQREFIEVADAQLSVDAWGMDTLTRKYRGDKAQLDAFLADFGKNRLLADTEFPYLFHTTHNATIGRAYADVTVEYKGLINSGSLNSPNPLPPVITSGSRTQSVQLQFVGDTLGASTGAVADVTYTAAYTKIRYITRGRPKERQYLNVIEHTSQPITILSRAGTPGVIKVFAGHSWRESTGSGIFGGRGSLQAYNGVMEVLPVQFEWTQAGQWYEVTETNEARMVPLDLANGLLTFLV